MKTATLLVAVTVFALASCASSPPPCDGPQTRNLSAAVDHVKGSLGNGCAAHFDRFYDDLLRTAEGLRQVTISIGAEDALYAHSEFPIELLDEHQLAGT